MKQHTALLDLPDELRRYGLNVITMDGWDTAQGFYRWTLPDGSKSYDNPPSGTIFHGTGTTVSRPVVRNRLGIWSKAGAWVGLDNGNGTLTTKPVVGSINRPTIYLTAAGPARVSAGRGYWPALEQMFNDVRPPLDAEGSTFPWRYANRYTFNVENTHPNDGSPIDPDVFDHLVGLGTVLHQMLGWRERTLGHRSWTRRKPVDPWFIPGGLPALQDQIQRELEGDPMSYTLFRADEFDLWSDQNIIDAYDRGRFEDTNREGFIQYWVTERDQRTATEKARFMTDYYARL